MPDFEQQVQEKFADITRLVWRSQEGDVSREARAVALARAFYDARLISVPPPADMQDQLRDTTAANGQSLRVGNEIAYLSFTPQEVIFHPHRRNSSTTLDKMDGLIRKLERRMATTVRPDIDAIWHRLNEVTSGALGCIPDIGVLPRNVQEEPIACTWEIHFPPDTEEAKTFVAMLESAIADENIKLHRLHDRQNRLYGFQIKAPSFRTLKEKLDTALPAKDPGTLAIY